MTEGNVPVNIQILDKEYAVSCPESERDGLLRSAAMLDNRMRSTRDEGKVLGTERLVVITALNIVHEQMQNQLHSEARMADVESEVRGLEDKISGALSRRATEEAVN